METDCIRVVQSLRNSVSLASTFGLIIANCKQLLQEIVDVDFVFVKRSIKVNKVAHCVVRLSCFVSDHVYKENNDYEILYICMYDILN